MLAFVDLEERVPPTHPLRTIKRLADQATAQLSPLFDQMYAQVGRPSIPPERLLKASLLISFYSVRSERAFCEELDYNLLFRWFLDMELIEPSFDATVFTKNRQRLLEHEIGQQLFDRVLGEAHDQGLLSDEHFTVDGTLIEAAASLKSFKPRDGEPPPSTGGLPWREALERHPPEHDGCGSPSAAQGQGKRSEAGVPGPRPDGEPARPAGGLPGVGGHGNGRAGRRAGAPGSCETATLSAHHHRR
jgi:transposase